MSTRRSRASRRTPPTSSPQLNRAQSRSMATDPQGLLDLVDWRRRVGDLYRTSGEGALTRFRKGRDDLFRSHPQSPIEPGDRSSFAGLHYFPHDPAYRVNARFEPGEGSELLIDNGSEDGAASYRRAGSLAFQLHDEVCRLTVLSLAQYAGGLFVPFRDATSGHET